MNCLEFRRYKLAYPEAMSAEAEAHRLSCAACAAFCARQSDFEAQLADAVRVPVPEGLAERVLLGQRLRRTVTVKRWALAAMLLLAIGAGWLYPRVAQQSLLANALVSRVLDQPDALTAHQLVSRAAVAQAFAASGAIQVGDIGEVRYLAHEQMTVPSVYGRRTEQVVHLVVQTPFGRASVLLLPTTTVSTDIMRTRNGLTVLVMPAGRGSCAVIGDSEQKVHTIAALMDRQIQWKQS